MKRAIITGIGWINALGCDRESAWKAIVRGECGIRDIDLFDTTEYRAHVAGQIASLTPEDHFSRRALRRMSRCEVIGLIAAREAVADAALELSQEDASRIAVVVGAGAGGMRSAEQYRRAQLEQPGYRPPPSLLLSFECGVLTDAIGSEFGCCGPRSTIVTACSSSATAIGVGLDLIRCGEADVVIAGGAESLCELTFGGFNSLRAVDSQPCRPFDLQRKGLSLGEGAGFLVLESEERVKGRNARGYAAVLGYSLSADAYHMTAPDPEGRGAEKVIKDALKDAGASLDDVDYVSAHGTGTKHNDRTEAGIIQKLWGHKAAQIPVSSTKSQLGHCLGAAGAVEAVALALAIDRGVIPPTVNYETPDPECPIDCVPNYSRSGKIRVGISNSFAFGGNNTTLVMGAVHD